MAANNKTVLALLLLICIATSGLLDNAEAGACKAGFELYKAKKGDSCWAIADGCGMKVPDLLKASGITMKQCNPLQVDQPFCVKANCKKA